MKSKNEITKDIELITLISQVPLSLVSSSGETLHCPMAEEHHFINSDMALQVLNSYKNKDLPEGIPYIHLYSLKILLGLVQISDDLYIFAGPVCITQISEENAEKAFSSVATSEEAKRLKLLLDQNIPVDFFRFAGVLATISNSNKNLSLTPSEIINSNFRREINVKPPEPLSFSAQGTWLVSSINFFQHTLFSIIATGNMDALIKHWQDNIIKSFVGINIPDEDIKFFFVPFYVFMFQGALKGGADINLCYEKYTYQIERFKKAQNTIEYVTELKRASYEYCNLVNESQKREYMPDVCSKCIGYINDHIHEKITSDMLAHILGIHRNKLYDIFHAHYDMTVSEYIEKERLRRAVLYLESSNYTISEIASSLGYSNQSHFTLIFKKHYGCTPGQYLKKKLNETQNP